jgi:hypothetical protein
VRGILHLALDPLQLLLRTDRPDVELALRPLAEGGDPLHHPAREFLVDLVDDVDPLRPPAELSRIGERPAESAVHRAIQIRVGADDHRILATERQGAGNQPPGAGLRDPATDGDAAGERDLVDASLGEGRTGLAVAEKHAQHTLGKTRRLEEIADQLPGVGGELGGLEQHRVARHQRLDARVEREQERLVPRRDDSHHAEGLVDDAKLPGQPLQAVHAPLPGAEDLGGALGVEAQRIAAGEDLRGDRLGPGLAGLAENHVDDFVLPLDQRAQRAMHVAGALVEIELRPARLRLARRLDRILHVVGRGDFELAGGLEGGWTAQAVEAP